MTAQTTEAWIPSDNFGSRLFLVRRQKRMTVEQIAKLCGIAQPTWTTWENGARPRDMVATIGKIVAATGVDRDWLMWGGPLSDASSSGGSGDLTGRSGWSAFYDEAA